MSRLVILAAALGVLVGCGGVDGDVTIEGQTLRPESCASLVPAGFDGVDLLFADGQVVRLFRTGTTISGVGWFPDPASDQGSLVGDCATGAIRDTNTKTNDVADLEGEVVFDCVDPLTVSGSASFSGCH